MVSVSFIVTSFEKSMVPGVHVLRGENQDNQEVLVELSDKLGLNYAPKDKLRLFIGKTKPKNIGEKDYCGKTLLYSIKMQGKKKIYLFSVGGFIIRIQTPRKIKGLEIVKEYNFCLSQS